MSRGVSRSQDRVPEGGTKVPKA